MMRRIGQGINRWTEGRTTIGKEVGELHERLSRKQPRRGGMAWRLHKVVEEGGFD